VAAAAETSREDYGKNSSLLAVSFTRALPRVRARLAASESSLGFSGKVPARRFLFLLLARWARLVRSSRLFSRFSLVR